jgi:sigma-B regulation protein RsbU (phosphoserine phosphatase)
MIAEEGTDEMQVLVARGVDGETLEQEGYSTTIVNEVISTRVALLTNNAQFDQRFSAGQSIIMRGLRAILCAPMLVHDRLVGVIYVDTSMRTSIFTEADRNLLDLVAGQAGRAIENARLYSVAVEKGRMERELQMASEIQRGLMPRQMPRIPGYEIMPQWKAAREVAGDFYDGFALGPESFGVVIADVSDKGAPAAMIMAVARTLMRSSAFAGLSALDTVKRANELILEDAERGGMFVTVFHSMFDVDGHSIHVNAGHNPPLLYRRASNSTEYLPIGGRAIGWFYENPVKEVHIQLEPGDVLVYYTDGLTEAENPASDYYGEERLSEAVLQCAGQSAKDILEYIIDDVDAFCAGRPPFDDLTMIVVRYTG